MIYYSPYKYGRIQVQFNLKDNDAYQSASVGSVKWGDFVDVPAEIKLGEHTFTRRWELPALAFSRCSGHQRNEQPTFNTVTDLYRNYYRACVRSRNETLKTLTFADWLELTTNRGGYNEVTAIDLFIDDEGKTWLVRVVKGEIEYTKLEKSTIIHGLVAYDLGALVQRRGAYLRQRLQELETMELRMMDESHILFFDDYHPEEPRLRMSSYIESLLGNS